MPDTENRSDVTDLTVQLLSAYLSNNSVASADLAELIRTTRAALTDNLEPAPADSAEDTYTPAVTVRKSLGSPDHILSLIDGKPYKTLKRHLAKHGLTPEAYRERYNLPRNYPMVAPSFTAQRREIAEKIGLGRKPTPGTVAKIVPSEPPAATVAGAAAAPKASSRKQVAAKKVVKAKAKPAASARPKSKSAATSAKPSAVEPVQVAEKSNPPVPAKAKASVRKVAKASARAKPAEKVMLTPPASDSSTPATVTASVAASPAPNKAAASPTKKRAGKPKVNSAKASNAAGAASSSEKQTSDTAQKKPSRSKLGVFRMAATQESGAAEGDKPSAVAASKASAGNGTDVVSPAPKPKRMARMPTGDAE